MRILLLVITSLLFSSLANAAESWARVVTEARGQTVYWNAWAGDERINAYIAWVGEQLEQKYGVSLRHVKVTDTAEVVARILAEKAAARDDDGSVDAIWINGENFAAMKRNGLLFGPWTAQLPNYSLVDTDDKPTTTVDFTVPVEGLEAPWGMAQFVFYHNSETVPEPPSTVAGLLAWAKQHPGRFSYPQPPDFIGSTFLKQILLQLIEDREQLQQPAPANISNASAPLWAYLDELHPVLWRSGQVFPANGPALRRLLGDSEIDIGLSFNPAEVIAAVADGELPESVKVFTLQGGMIGNTHFIAIPYNATAKQGAMVLADFLLSPEAQARKQNIRYWGDPSVLDLDRLSTEQRALFIAESPLAQKVLPPDLGATLPEPHPSWMEAIEAEWQRRYASGN